MRLVLCLLLLSLSVISQPVLASEPARSITVVADGYVESVPDTLQLRIVVKQTRNSLKDARETVDSIVAQVTDIAGQSGIAKDDIDSSRLNSWPEYEWRKQERHYLGESVQREVVLKVRDLSRYGSLIEQLSKLKLAGIQPR